MSAQTLDVAAARGSLLPLSIRQLDVICVHMHMCCNILLHRCRNASARHQALVRKRGFVYTKFITVISSNASLLGSSGQDLDKLLSPFSPFFFVLSLVPQFQVSVRQRLLPLSFLSPLSLPLPFPLCSHNAARACMRFGAIR